MSESASPPPETWGFAPPAFDALAAIARLRKDLREMGLNEREGVFERRGVAIARLQEDSGEVQAAVVKRPLRQRPGLHDWDTRCLRSSADVRDWAASVKKKLAQWSDHDD